MFKEQIFICKLIAICCYADVDSVTQRWVDEGFAARFRISAS